MMLSLDDDTQHVGGVAALLFNACLLELGLGHRRGLGNGLDRDVPVVIGVLARVLGVT